MYSDRLNRIAPFRVMELLERARILEGAGHRVVHFEVGEPDFPTAEAIARAGIQAIVEGHTKYTVALGIPELRQKIAQYYRDLGVDVPWQRVVVTAGASGALILLNGLLLNPGDQLLVTDPGYPCNEAFAALVNAEAQHIVVSPSDGFQVTGSMVAEHWQARTMGLLLASPANPTGAIQRRAGLAEVFEEVHGRDGFVVLDEIYQGLIYQAAPEYRSALEIDPDIFVLNSFSKYFGMTGWRLGWMVIPSAAVEPVSRLAQNLFISPSAIAQRAALAAFSPAAMEIHESRRLEFVRRRDRLSEGLQELGFAVSTVPQGAFYLYVDISRTGLSSEDFCWRLINEFHVAATPGVDFGSHRADEFVRFAYTTDLASIEIGLERMATALAVWGCECS